MNPERADQQMSFGQRQFAHRRTPAQLWFDVIVGLVVPPLCIWFDPIVFRSQIGGAENTLGANAIFFYACLALSWGALTVWLVSGRAWGVSCGLLVMGALLSCIVGLVVLPLSLIGLLVVIGALGFAPFLAGFVFIRNAWRIYCRLKGSGSKANLAIGLGLAISIAVPTGMQVLVDQEIESAIHQYLDDDPVVRGNGLEKMRRYGFASSVDRLISRYTRESDAVLRERARLAYRNLTGDDIERRLAKDAD